MSASLTRRGFLKAAAFVIAGAALLRAVPASRATAQTAPPEKDYQRMVRLRVEHLLAGWNPPKREAMGRELVALSLALQASGTTWAQVSIMEQKSLRAAQRKVAALPPARLPRAMASSASGGRLMVNA